ncbi:MAG: hypothetical protein U0802_13650 [Candidatus Binatia bacterium]
MDALSRRLAAHKQALGYDAMLGRLGAGAKAVCGISSVDGRSVLWSPQVSATDVVVEGMSAGETVQGIEALMLGNREEREIVDLGACQSLRAASIGKWAPGGH